MVLLWRELDDESQLELERDEKDDEEVRGDE